MELCYARLNISFDGRDRTSVKLQGVVKLICERLEVTLLQKRHSLLAQAQKRCLVSLLGKKLHVDGLDRMAAFIVSAALSKKGSGVLAGVVESRIARDEPCGAAVRDQRRSGDTDE
jgi:hypothetical protein